jgi:DNA-binding transcriptional MerR regulator
VLRTGRGTRILVTVKMGELAKRSGLPVSTIKFYLRENLLPAGRATAANQADYTEDHVRRLRVIRVLVEIGGLGTATVREVLSSPCADGLAASGLRARAMVSTYDDVDEGVQDDVRDFLTRRGWSFEDGHPAVRALVTALTAARRLGDTELAGRLDLYADAATRTAEAEVSGGSTGSEATVAAVLGDVLLSALRGLALEQLLAAAVR